MIFRPLNSRKRPAWICLLVGGSLGGVMRLPGYSGTIPTVVMDQMIFHANAVRRGAPNTFVIGDMPFMSYQSSLEKGG